METTHDDIVIAGAVRTPIGKFMGSLASVPVTVLGSTAIAAAVKRAGVTASEIDEVLMGCVLTGNAGQAPARQAALNAGLLASSPAITVNKVCGSGLTAVMLAADGIRLGHSRLSVAGGMECMSGAPYLVPKARLGYKAGHGALLDHLMRDGLEDAYETGRPMGEFGEQTAALYGFTREEQDAYARETVLRAQAALAERRFGGELVGVSVDNGGSAFWVDFDEIPGKLSTGKIPGLKPAFKTDGTITAASSSANGDAAAAVVVTTRANADRLGAPVLATIRGYASHARKPSEFTLAPAGAVQKALDRAGWQCKDIDLFEINEAFAVVVMAAMRDLGIKHDRVNVNGGACALGHPIGASGARVLVTLIHAMQARSLHKGIATLCIGGGEAVAMAIEVH